MRHYHEIDYKFIHRVSCNWHSVCLIEQSNAQDMRGTRAGGVMIMAITTAT